MAIEDLVGQAVGEFEVEALNKFGSYTSYYRAFQPRLQRHVVIKFPTPSVLHDTDTRNRLFPRFALEAAVMNKLEHPGVLPLYDSPVVQMRSYDGVLEIPFHVMRFTSGGRPLSDAALPSHQILNLLRNLTRLTDAIDYIHDQGIVHRLLVPDAFAMDASGSLYVDEFHFAEDTGQPRGTMRGEFAAVPYYCPPETWVDSIYSPAADQYTFGCTMFYVLAGKRVFEIDNEARPAALMYKHVNTPPPRISEVNPDLPPILDGIFQRVLAKDPEKRYPNATAFAETLVDAWRYQGKSKKLFVSYSSRDLSSVTDVVRDLRAFGHQPWYDRELLQAGGHHWWDKILENIRSADAITFVMSRESLESHPCQLELQYARDLNKRVVPVLIDEGVDVRTVPAWLAQLQYVNLTLPDGPLSLRTSLDQLPEALPLPPELPASPPVPISELSQLAEQINLGAMEPDDQLLMITKLELLLDDSHQSDAALVLLKKLAARTDLSAIAVRKLQRVLKIAEE